MHFKFTGIDLIGPLQESEGKKYIATSMCSFTKFVEAKVIPNKTAEQVGIYIYELFSHYGMMKGVISDQVKYFTVILCT